MTKIVILGGTGFTGTNIAKEAAARGYDVVAVSRHAPAEPLKHVYYVQASLLDVSTHEGVVGNADVIVGALAPRGELVGKVGEIYASIEKIATEKHARFIVIGGFGSLSPKSGEPSFVESGSLPDAYAAESKEMFDVLTHLKTTPESFDWLYVSPASNYGAHAPGEATGGYRIGGDVALYDEHGESAISGEDFALGIVDEIKAKEHHREHVSLIG